MNKFLELALDDLLRMTPEELRAKRIEVGKKKIASRFRQTLEHCALLFKSCDERILELLITRDKLSHDLAALKYIAGAPVYRPHVEKKRIAAVVAHAKKGRHSNPKLVERVMRAIIVDSRNLQKGVIKDLSLGGVRSLEELREIAESRRKKARAKRKKK